MSCPCSRCFSNPSTPHSEPSSSSSSSPSKKNTGFPWFRKSSGTSANPPRYSVESTASDLVGLLGRDSRRTTTKRDDAGVGSAVGWTWR
ncbi:hypothetical protein QBC45DRAFT_338521 [Copromyces sp. CBS 386.78]|nr:hypothetical protein QBC45DRAFT_338521 [Copromyces sp. CBS 386.78]